MELWKIIYTADRALTRDSKIQSFQFKVTHRILACGYNLALWKIKDNSDCKICLVETDTIEHHLVQCKLTYAFWLNVLKWFKSVSNVSFDISIYEILFGIPNETQNTVINQLNFLLLMGRYYVYKAKQKNENLDFFTFLHNCKNHLLIEQEIRAIANESDVFNKKWGELMNSL